MSVRRSLAMLRYRFMDSRFYIFLFNLRKRLRVIFKRDVCVLCSEFLRRYRNEDRETCSDAPYYIYKEGFLVDYMKLMRRILKTEFGLSGSTDVLIADAAYGNWKNFWETYEESAESLETVFENLCCDIGYCSDRFNWDRFLRINWAYQRVKRRLEDMEDGDDNKSGL